MTQNRKKHAGQFRPQSAHLRYRTDKEVFDRLSSLSLGTLQLTGKISMDEGSRRYAECFCYICKETRNILVDNILGKKTKNCRCQRNVKYPQDGSADILGQRYDAMIQRCTRDTHVSSHNYKGRGIKVLFKSREAFIRWALEKFPHTNFRGLDFDRIDNDGDYSKENLRLVTRKVNLSNTRRAKL